MRVRVLGSLENGLLRAISASAEHLPIIVDQTGRVPVERVVDEQTAPDGDSVLVLTGGDLALRGCKSLFGFADHRRRVAVVSTYRLGGNAGRLARVVAHETGHLRGLRHCSTQGCVMRKARTVDELDACGLGPCARCMRPTPRFRALIAASVFCALAFAGGDAIGGLLGPHSPPFSWRSQGGTARVFYKQQPVLEVHGRIPNAAADRRIAALSRNLNALFADIAPPRLKVVAGGPDRAVILAGDARLFELSSADTDGREPLQASESWVRNIEPLLRGKGFEGEGCPDCHIRRLPEVLETVRNRGKWRR
jgi:hypothetical protein